MFCLYSEPGHAACRVDATRWVIWRLRLIRGRAMPRGIPLCDLHRDLMLANPDQFEVISDEAIPEATA